METSFEEIRMKSEELLKDKNKLRLRWSSILGMLSLRDLRDNTQEKSSTESGLNMSTIKWRFYTGLLLSSGRGNAGKQCLPAVDYVQAHPEPRTERPKESKKQSQEQHMVSVALACLPQAWQTWWKAFPACHGLYFLTLSTGHDKERTPHVWTRCKSDGKWFTRDFVLNNRSHLFKLH